MIALVGTAAEPIYSPIALSKNAFESFGPASLAVLVRISVSGELASL
jgi:hypothetical protein